MMIVITSPSTSRVPSVCSSMLELFPHASAGPKASRESLRELLRPRTGIASSRSAHTRPGGGAALRRLAAVLELAGGGVPAALAAAAAREASRASYLYLGERRVHGARGPRLRDWAVVDNVGGETLREEIDR